MSQPALSAQVALVEEALGVRLFDRDRRRVLLTPAGSELLSRARELLLAADELVLRASQLTEPFTGTIRIGIIPTIAPYLLPEMAPLLKQEYPRLTEIWVEDKTESLMQRLRDGELEGAVVALESKLGEVDHALIGDDAFVLAAPPGHPVTRGKRKIAAGRLDGHSFLLLDDGHCFRDQALEFCSNAGASEMAVRATSLSTLVQMAAAGAGLTLLPSLAIPVENRGGTLHVRRFAGEPPKRTLALVWRPRSAVETTLRALARTMARSYRTLSDR